MNFCTILLISELSSSTSGNSQEKVHCWESEFTVQVMVIVVCFVIAFSICCPAGGLAFSGEQEKTVHCMRHHDEQYLLNLRLSAVWTEPWHQNIPQ